RRRRTAPASPPPRGTSWWRSTTKSPWVVVKRARYVSGAVWLSLAGSESGLLLHPVRPAVRARARARSSSGLMGQRILPSSARHRQRQRDLGGGALAH